MTLGPRGIALADIVAGDWSASWNLGKWFVIPFALVAYICQAWIGLRFQYSALAAALFGFATVSIFAVSAIREGTKVHFSPVGRASGLPRLLLLLPYGNHLLTESARFWIFAASIQLVLLAAAQALIMGRLVFNLLSSWAGIGLAIAIGIGLTYGMFVLPVGTSLLTLDMSKHSSPDKRTWLVTFAVVARVSILVLGCVAPMMAQVELALPTLGVAAMTILLMTGLAALKLFQPESVKLYYSLHLQSLFAEYKAGRFDELLAPSERDLHEIGGMTPFRFSEWIRHVYEPLRSSDDRKAQVEVLATQLQLAAQSLDAIAVERDGSDEARLEILSKLAEHGLRVELNKDGDLTVTVRLRPHRSGAKSEPPAAESR